MYPLTLEPIFKERIWGGDKLKTIFNKNLPAGVKIGESWELTDVNNDKSIITNGKFKGKNIAELLHQNPAKLIGKNLKGPFPLLIKFLDAQDNLSVQVHPDSKTCLKMGTGQPKTECWYIVDAAPGAVIYKGLKKGVTKTDFLQAIKEGNTDELLNCVKVQPGQCHFLPAGTPHAIGAGLVIAEIQTPSDTTYRIFDWNRVDANGRSRQLHIDEAMESINFSQSSDELTVTSIGRLVDCEYFKLDKGHQMAYSETLLQKTAMQVIIILSGSGRICAEDVRVNFEKGQTILIPANCQAKLQFQQDCQYLTVSL